MGTIWIGNTTPYDAKEGDFWFKGNPGDDWGAFAPYVWKTFTTGGEPVPKLGNEKEDYGMTAEVLPGSMEDMEREVSREVELDGIEEQMFSARDEIEVLWLKMGSLAADIVDKKLYQLRKDENGNHFRTAKAYFQDLDRRFKERGQNFSYTTINRFIDDYRLYLEGKSGVTLTPAEAVLVGKSSLEKMAPAIRKLQKEGKPEEAVALVESVVEAAKAGGGIPTAEVVEAVNEATGRVMKGLNVEFGKGIFGKKVTSLKLWWDGRAIDLLKSEISDEQAEWLQRRLGIKPGTLV